jgi:hypothetical protein
VPSTSKKQHNFMAAVANNPKFAKKAGVPRSVGEDFLKADKGRKFKEGGEMAESKKMVGKEIAFMKKKGAPKSMLKHEMAEMKGKKMAMGGFSSMPTRDTSGISNMPTRDTSGISNMPYMPAKPGGFSTGVTNKLPPGSRPGVGSSPGNMGGRPGGYLSPPGGEGFDKINPPALGLYPGKGMRKGGLAAGHKQADGIAKKGKTRGMEVKMAAGGLAAGHKQADGIAKKGKTKAMQVKMAGGGYKGC